MHSHFYQFHLMSGWNLVDEIGGGIEAHAQDRDSSGMDDDLSNGTMDMSTSHNNTSHSHSNAYLSNHVSSSSNNVSNLSSHTFNHSSAASLLNMNMGIDLSNHGGQNQQHIRGLGADPQNLSLSLSMLNNSLAQHNNAHNNPAKRRKKETPRRLDIPRAVIPTPVFNSTMMAADNMEEEYDDNASDEESMTIQEFQKPAEVIMII